MAVASPKHTPQQDQRDQDSPAGAFISALDFAHQEVEPCIVGLEKIMASGDRVDLVQFSGIRLRVARANLARTQVGREACSHLMLVTPPTYAQDLSNL